MMQVRHWENHLLDLAAQALNSRVVEHAVNDEQILRSAYLRCEKITQEHSKTFYAASRLMPQNKRHATRALYAFCRVSDDIVDRPAVLPEMGQASLCSAHAQIISNRLENWRSW